jgi:hypothetical protein
MNCYIIKAVNCWVYSVVIQIVCDQSKHYVAATLAYVCVTIYHVGRRDTGQILRINHIYKPL